MMSDHIEIVLKGNSELLLCYLGCCRRLLWRELASITEQHHCTFAEYIYGLERSVGPERVAESLFT